MAQDLFRAELGYAIEAANGDELARVLSGSGAPGADGGVQDDAPIGSLYLRTSNGALYKKTVDNNLATDWKELSDLTIDQLSWRNEKVRALTDDTIVAGAGIDPTSWSDNDSGVDATNWDVGDYVIGDGDGSPALFEITAKVSGTSITLAAASQPIADNDTFVVQAYLPDVGASQEVQAIFHVPTAGSAGVKIGDVNWNLADGINLNGYTESQGPVTGSDTVQTAIEKTGGDVSDLVTLSGVARGSTVLGAFASPASVLMAATYTVKSALQRLGDLYAQLRGVESAAVTSSTVLDSTTAISCKWIIHAVDDTTSTNREAYEVHALNDGTSVDYNIFSKLKLGSGINETISVAMNGADMELSVAAAAAATFRARRIEVVKNVL